MCGMTSLSVPPLGDNDIHLWHTPWPGGAGEARFAALLAAYATPDAPVAPEVLRGAHGKPYFASPFDTVGFSWSHSGTMALLAVGRGPAGFELGVDVEVLRPRPRALELARRFFAPSESALLEALPEAERLKTFLALWTAKEAVLKAHGGGLSYGLHRAAFSLADGEVVAESFEGEIAPAASWTIRPVDLGASAFASVAWRGSSRTVRFFTSSL